MTPVFDFKTTFNLINDPGQIFVEDLTVYAPEDPAVNISSVIQITSPANDLLPQTAIDNDVSVTSDPGVIIPQDYAQNLIKGEYCLSIVTTIVDKFYSYDIINSTTGGTPTVVVAGDTTGPQPTSLTIVNSTSGGNGVYNIVNIEVVEGTTVYELDSDPGVIITDGQINFNWTTEYTTDLCYDFCYEPVSIDIDMVGDCFASRLTSKDATQYGNYESLVRVHTLKYPDGLQDQFPDVVTGLQTNQVTPIYTKTWTSIIESDVVYLQEDGLCITDRLIGSQEYEVDCSVNFCKLYNCMKSFYELWMSKKKDNPLEAQRLGYKWGQLTALWTLAKTAAECGKNDDLKCWFKQMTEILNSEGCNCVCEGDDSELPTLIESAAGCDCEGAVIVESGGNGIIVDVNVDNNVVTYTLTLDQSVLDGLDGEDGLGYDNMQSATTINESTGLPFALNTVITDQKAVGPGTRLKYSRIGDNTKYLVGNVNTYDVNTGACNITFDFASAAAGGVHAGGYDVSVAGEPGVDGTSGLGYENMVCNEIILALNPVPFTDSMTITAQKAVTAGTRLRYAVNGFPDLFIEGVVTAYDVNTGATTIDFDLKSSPTPPNNNDWTVTVIGEPGVGVAQLANVGTGEDVYKGLNVSTAELRRLLGANGLAFEVNTVGDDIVFSPLAANQAANEVVVYQNGVGTAPTFNIAAGAGETLVSPGTIDTQSKVFYYDWNDVILLLVDVRILNLQLNGPNEWSLGIPSLIIGGLPVFSASAEPEDFALFMTGQLSSGVPDPDFIMKVHRPVRMVTNNGNIGLKVDSQSTRMPTSNEDVDIRIYGHIVIKKNQ